MFYWLKDFLGCGVIETKKSRMNEVVYCVYKYSDMLDKVISFFSNNEIIGVKNKDFKGFCKAILLIKDKNYINKEKLNSAIALIKNGMNMRRSAVKRER